MSDPKPTVEDLFHACRALRTQSERAAYLDRVTAGNPSLRTRVEQLLAADAAEDTSFLQPKPVANAAKVPAGEQAGQMIDRYKLLQELGEGGMGTVWMAEQREPVVRKVALKIIKLGMDTREVVVRFEAERQALALMDHPHIAKVLDGGSTASGRPFFVMELVKGVPITEYADQAKLGLRERLELFTKVCEAIQHAHHKGIIHRDIKPTNVLVTLHDGIAIPKVIDFGIAKATSAELTKKTLFTQYAQVLGTPEYMAPEQAEMSGLDIDTRADVYSLGVLLYELLTGQKPFDIQQALAVGFQELLRTIREDDPQKPSTRVSTLGELASPVAAHRELNVESWSKRLRGDLDWIVMKALEGRRKVLGTDHAETLSTAGNLGVNLRDTGDLLAALPLLEEAWRGRQLHPQLVWVGTELLAVLARLGKTAAGKVLVDELVREKRATVPADSVELASLLSSLGQPMCDLQLWAEAEVLLRECVAIREAKQPELWNTWNAKSLLGGALLGQQQFAAAETLLLAGCEGLQQRESTMPAAAKLRITEAMGRLVALYTAWEQAEPGVGHAAKAAVWRERAAARTSGGGR